MPHQNILMVSDSNVSTNKDSTYNNAFTIVLNSPLKVPHDAKNISVSCPSANIVNFFYNVSATLGNNIMYYTDDVALPQKYTITFPDGAYDFSDMNQEIKMSLIANSLAIDTLKFYSQPYTQKISIAIKNGFGVKMPNGVAQLLGYPHVTGTTYFNAGATTMYYDATESAKFNNIISLNLNCDLVSSNYFNGQFSNLLSSIPITASVGRIINYTPYIPIKIDCPQLAGSVVNSISLMLMDQLNRAVTISEAWNASITIEWED